MLLDVACSQLVVIDLQERLLPAMRDGEGTVRNATNLVTAATRLGVPVTVSEQYPRGLGRTTADILDALGNDARIFEKLTFSAAREPSCAEYIADIAAREGRRQIVVCGIESHICALQTSLDLAQAGYDVFAAVDAMSSRTALSLETALRRMAAGGVTLVTSEMVLFEWLERAGSEDFRALSKLIR